MVRIWSELFWEPHRTINRFFSQQDEKRCVRLKRRDRHCPHASMRLLYIGRQRCWAKHSKEGSAESRVVGDNKHRDFGRGSDKVHLTWEAKAAMLKTPVAPLFVVSCQLAKSLHTKFRRCWNVLVLSCGRLTWATWATRIYSVEHKWATDVFSLSVWSAVIGSATEMCSISAAKCRCTGNTAGSFKQTATVKK